MADVFLKAKLDDLEADRMKLQEDLTAAIQRVLTVRNRILARNRRWDETGSREYVEGEADLYGHGVSSTDVHLSRLTAAVLAISGPAR